MSEGSHMEIYFAGHSPVHLNFVDLDALFLRKETQITKILSADEIERGARFLKLSDKKRFLSSRFFLRNILAEFTGQDPTELRFSHNSFGKPYLECGSINFNLSHSGSYAVIAHSNDVDVGVDIETKITHETAEEISSRILSPEEYSLWKQSETDQRITDFREYWTLKEALLKADGCGLSQDPQAIELRLDQPHPVIVKLPESMGPVEGYGLQLINPPAPCPVVALAVKY